MELVLNTPGAYLNVKDGLFAITVEKNKTTISPAKVERILLTSDAVLTTAVVKLCAQHNIDLVVLERNGDPVGRFWHARFGSIATIRRRQLELQHSEKGIEYAREWVTAKLTNQVEFIKDLAKNRPKLHDSLVQKAATIEDNIRKLATLQGSVEEKRGTIIGWEGSASRVYFDILSLCLPEAYRFSGRSRQPAKDPFNAFLNYAYGILYSEVEKACIIAGLDPFVGFVHTDNYNKKSLVFDIIENFRIYGDRVVFRLFSKKMVNQKMVDPVRGGAMLNREGKKLLFDEHSKFYEKVVRFGRKNMKRAQTIQAFCHQFANALIKEGSPERG
jgi:CRISPR-associated protein Cas1